MSRSQGLGKAILAPWFFVMWGRGLLNMVGDRCIFVSLLGLGVRR